MPDYGTIDQDYAIKLATTAPDDDGPVWMVNLMRYKEQAEYADGRETTLTGREADDEYAPFGPLAAVGAEVVFVADVEDQFIGEEPKWDRIGVVKYPTRAAFIEMQRRDDFQKAHEHKEAGMAETIVIGTQPLQFPEIPNPVDWRDTIGRIPRFEERVFCDCRRRLRHRRLCRLRRGLLCNGLFGAFAATAEAAQQNENRKGQEKHSKLVGHGHT